MADFRVPFGNNNPDGRRLPTAQEREQGYVAGAAKRTLMNGQMHTLESELGYLMQQAGIVGDPNNLTQVHAAVVALIEAATGSGATENYVQFGQLASTMPVYPEVVSTSGAVNVISPTSNQLQVPSGVVIRHRGLKDYTTDEVNLTELDHSSIYHIRWSPTGGVHGTVVAKNLADTEYNPDSDPETHSKFDSTFDDVLLARAVSNSSGAFTITNLVNRANLEAHESVVGQNWETPKTNTARADLSYTYNWARTPRFHSLYRVYMAHDGATSSSSGNDMDEYLFQYGTGTQISKLPFTRYDLKCRVGIDFAHGVKYDLSIMA